MVYGAIGKLKCLSQRGGYPVIQLKNGNEYTLTCSSATLYLNDYTPHQRRMLQSGRLRPSPDRPVAKLTYSHHRLKMALRSRWYFGCGYHSPQCRLLVALIWLCLSGMDDPGKLEMTMVTPKTTLLWKGDGLQPRGLYLT